MIKYYFSNIHTLKIRVLLMFLFSLSYLPKFQLVELENLEFLVSAFYTDRFASPQSFI